jgi:molecular chaperone DnaK
LNTIQTRNNRSVVERTRSFVTSHDRQTTVVIAVCQGESRKFSENAPLGTLTLEGIPPRPRGEAEIEVTFVIDTDGILHVRARDTKTNQSTQAKILVFGAPEQKEPATPPPNPPAVAK